MALACQRNSYLQTLTTTVVSCEPSNLKLLENGKKVTVKGFDVVLEDTVLFPEGGGQPDDRGTIADRAVLRVVRNGTKAVHFVENELNVGERVDVRIDWKRRFDHMQQHSGQHLITAIADSMFGFNTTSWNLGDKTSSIELDVPSMTDEQMLQIESTVNQKIRECMPVNVQEFESGAEELKNIRSRGLPDDHSGPIRIITIEGVESNMCCGTHVKNLADLQMIKLLYAEKGKKNKTNLFFVAGNRVLDYLQNCCEKEKKFTSFLKGGPEQHVDLLEKMHKSLKLTQKNELTLIRDMAILEAQKLKAINPKPQYFSIHRKEGNLDFMNIIVGEVNDDDVLLFLSIGDDKGAGQIMIAGQAAKVSKLGPRVGELLEGKGFAKGNRYQGKVNNMSQRSVAEEFLKTSLDLENGSL